jgi:hypothetical protein
MPAPQNQDPTTIKENVMTATPDPKRELLRHTVATLAYRACKAVRNAPPGFEDFRASESGRSAGELLAHLGDLIDWALTLAKGEQTWKASESLVWDKGAKRFFASLQSFDDYLASAATLQVRPEKLFQGPIADALTHVGQINMLRRLAGEPVKSEVYFTAEIVGGRVGAEQAKPELEF